MELLHDPDRSRPRDPVEERRERQRYWLLAGIHERAGARTDVSVHGLEVGQAMGLSREEIFRHTQFLAQHDFLHYAGAGPRVHLTEKGLRYLSHEAQRRRSIRSA